MKLPSLISCFNDVSTHLKQQKKKTTRKTEKHKNTHTPSKKTHITKHPRTYSPKKVSIMQLSHY